MNNLEAKILLAEDRTEDAYLTEFALESGGFDGMIHWVKDGEEALNYLYRKGPYENRKAVNPLLILLDLNMPKVNGIEVLEKIKKDRRLQSIPVVMLTTSKEELDREKAYSNHVNSYIIKPVDLDKFKEVIKDLGTYWLIRNTTL